MSSKPLYLTEGDVERLLPMGESIALVRAAFARLARGEAINHPRRRLILPTRSALHYMAGADGAYYGIKVYSTNPGHEAHFRFLLYRAADAALLAILEANSLGQIRTGAASGLATDLLARAGRAHAGSDRQRFPGARAVEAMLAVRRFERVRAMAAGRRRNANRSPPIARPQSRGGGSGGGKRRSRGARRRCPGHPHAAPASRWWPQSGVADSCSGRRIASLVRSLTARWPNPAEDGALPFAAEQAHHPASGQPATQITSCDAAALNYHARKLGSTALTVVQ